jgi:glycosyltransferase involved in cell wall biosynthesis
MKLAIVNLTAGGLSGGYRKYLQRLVPLLQNVSGVSGLEIFIPERATTTITLEGVPLRTIAATDAYRGYAQLKTHLRASKPDVVFIPTANWLHCGPIPVVAMVRNMEPLLVPFEGNSLIDGLKNLARTYAARRASQRSCRVIAVSQYVRDFITQRWGLAIDRVGVVPHGIEPPVTQSEAIMPRSLADVALGKFIFTAGSIRPARGLEDIIEAVAWLNHSDPSITLVIGGEPNPDTHFYHDRMQRLAADRGITHRVIWVGQLNVREMAWCFYTSAAFVMTSRAEACPNTVLEALSHGCLSVSTDHPPMPEFFGDTAYYYRARDARSLAEQLMAALNAPEADRQAKRLAAIRRARQFDWRTTAERTIEQLRLATKSGQ